MQGFMRAVMIVSFSTTKELLMAAHQRMLDMAKAGDTDKGVARAQQDRGLCGTQMGKEHPVIAHCPVFIDHARTPAVCYCNMKKPPEPCGADGLFAPHEEGRWT
jgi:hypothetical protein